MTEKCRKTIVYAGLFDLPDRDAAAHRVNMAGQMMVELGYNVVFVGLSREPENVSEADHAHVRYFAERMPRSGKEWIRIQTSCAYLFNVLHQLTQVERVILYNYPSFPFGAIRRYCRTNRIQLLADCTEWYHSEWSDNMSLIKNGDTFKRMHLDYLKLDGLICISNFLEDYYTRRGIRCMKLPPVIDCTGVHSRIELHVRGRKHLIYPGIPYHKDDILVMLQGLALLSKEEREQVVFHMTSLDEANLRSYLRNDAGIIDQLKDILVFHGFLSREALMKLYRSVDFLYMSRPGNRVTRANFPSKVPELMARGIVPICNQVGDYHTYMADDVNAILFDDDDPEKCAIAIRRALQKTPEEIVSMKRAAVACAKASFDYRSWLEPMRVFLEG